MGNSIEAYRAANGSFMFRIKDRKRRRKSYPPRTFRFPFMSSALAQHIRDGKIHRFSSRSARESHFAYGVTLGLLNVSCILLLICGDIESNPGPTTCTPITVCHANIRSLKANDNMSVMHADAATSSTSVKPRILRREFMMNSFELVSKTDWRQWKSSIAPPAPSSKG